MTACGASGKKDLECARFAWNIFICAIRFSMTISLAFDFQLRSDCPIAYRNVNHENYARPVYLKFYA